VAVLEEVRDQPKSAIDALPLLDAQRLEVGLHLLDHDRPVLRQPRPSGIGERELRRAAVRGTGFAHDESGFFEFGEELRRRGLRAQISLREMAHPYGLILLDDCERTQRHQRVLIADHSSKRSGQARRDDNEPRHEFSRIHIIHNLFIYSGYAFRQIGISLKLRSASRAKAQPDLGRRSASHGKAPPHPPART
jgi:hypothetical protein